jgi:adenylate cyclase
LKIQYALEGRTVETAPGESILATSLRAGIPHAHACGGRAKCSTCRVEILDGLDHCPPRNEKETLLASRLHFAPQIRLACQTVITGDVTLRRLILDDVDINITSQIREGALVTDVGEDKELAVLFADIRDFTPFAEALPAYDVIHILNRFFSQMGRAITLHGGHIDNYMGDGLMALFGLAGGDAEEDAALRAVRAGLAMLDEMESFKRYLQNIYGRSLEIGVGIHYGDVVVGSIVASRVESANKQAGTKLLISPSTFERLADVVTIGKTISVNLKGTTGETVLREVIGIKVA